MKFPGVILTFLLGLIPLSTWAQPGSATEFIAAYRTAMQEKSIEKLDALTYTVGMSESDRKQVAALQQMLFSNDGGANRKIAGISLEPLPADFQPVAIVNGKKWEPTYLPAGQIKIQYEGTANGPNSSSQYYAIMGGHYFLVSTKSTDLGWKGPPDKTLGFMVMGRGPQNKVQVTVKWNASGVEQERVFRESSALFLGQYVEQITVTSDDPDATLTVSEGGKEIFHSQPLKGKGTIEYKKS